MFFRAETPSKPSAAALEPVLRADAGQPVSAIQQPVSAVQADSRPPQFMQRREQRNTGRNAGIIAGLDIGSTKIACFIAEVRPDSGIVVHGIGQRAAAGIRGGEVTDMSAVCDSIGQTVEAAETMAGIGLDRVSICLGGGLPVATSRYHDIELAGAQVTERDLQRLARADLAYYTTEGRQVLHRLPVQYKLDNNAAVRDPIGMAGRRLGMKICVVTAEASTVQTMIAAAAQNHLKVDKVVSAGYAACLASLKREEKELGATVIDFGGGVTQIAVFTDGQLSWLDAIPIGGDLVTRDIARGLGISMADAERLKTLHGSVLTAYGDSDRVLTLPVIGDNAPQQVEMDLLGEIIRPRIDEILEMLMQRMEQAGRVGYGGPSLAVGSSQQIILTGGGAQLPGMREHVSNFFNRSARPRIGTPLGLVGLADAANTPAFAATAGLLIACSQPDPLALNEGFQESSFFNLTLGRIGTWLRNNI